MLGVVPSGGRPPLTLCDMLFDADVGGRLGCLLRGDSGLGREGRFGLNIGLVGLAPGPTDLENFAGTAGVGGVYAFCVRLPLNVLWEGVVGVPGYESVAPEGDRLSARWIGRKIPEPGMDVSKYCVL